MSQPEYELAANIWAISDQHSTVIQRFAARAYVMTTGDNESIVNTLKVLAKSDHHCAKQYPIPSMFSITMKQGTIEGVIYPTEFNANIDAIIDSALEDLENSCPNIVGVSTASGQPKGVSLNLRFHNDSCIVLSHLIEDLHGNLTPCPL
jgi:hypothetical protein